MIRQATPDDAQAILNIYSYYVKNSHATFELVPPTVEEMHHKIQASDYPWFVFVSDGKVIGYSYITRWKAREAYDRTVESSVYLHQDAIGKGIASDLYNTLISWLKKEKYHAVLAGISLPNDPSIALHEKFGFKKVGQLQQVGYKFDRWIDVGYWELLL